MALFLSFPFIEDIVSQNDPFVVSFINVKSFLQNAVFPAFSAHKKRWGFGCLSGQRLVGLPTPPKEGLAEGRLSVEPGCLSPSTREGSREMLLPLLNTKQPCSLYLCQSETRNLHRLVLQQICTAFTVLSSTQRSYCHKQWVVMQLSIWDRDNEVGHGTSFASSKCAFDLNGILCNWTPDTAAAAQAVLSLLWIYLAGEAALFQGGNLEKQRKPEAAAWTIKNGAALTEKNNTIQESWLIKSRQLQSMLLIIRNKCSESNRALGFHSLRKILIIPVY